MDIRWFVVHGCLESNAPWRRLAPMRSIPVGYGKLASMNQNQSKCRALFLGDLDVWGILSQRFYTPRK